MKKILIDTITGRRIDEETAISLALEESDYYAGELEILKSRISNTGDILTRLIMYLDLPACALNDVLSGYDRFKKIENDERDL